MTSLTLTQSAPDVMAHLADAAMRSIILSCLAALVLAVFHVRLLSIRLVVWKGVLYAALAMPLLVWLLPVIPVRVPVPLKQVTATAPMAGAPQLAEPDRATPVERAERSGRFLREARTMRASRAVSASMKTAMDWRVVGATSPVSAANSSGQTAETWAQSERQRSASSRLLQMASGLRHELQPALTELSRPEPWVVLLGIYLAGVAFLLARLGVGLVLSRRLLRSCTRVDDSRALRWLQWHAVAMGPKRVPVLAESSAVSVPLTLGDWHPVIVIPSDWRDWPSAKLAAVMAHEVAHIRRNDSRTRALALIYRSIFWFSPLGWWLEKRLADLAEQASDEAAIRAGAEPTFYAEVLMSFFETSTSQGRVSWQGISMARGQHASKRIERVLSSGGVVPVAIRAPIVVLLALCALPMVCLTAATRPVLVASAASVVSQSAAQAVSQPSGQTAAHSQLPEPPPPAEPVPPSDSQPTPPAPAAPLAPVAPAVPQAAPPSAAPAVPGVPPAPANPDYLAHMYRHLEQMSRQADALSASAQYREMLAEASAAYAKAARAYRYAYSQSGTEAAARYQALLAQARAAYAKAARGHRYSYSQSAGTTITNSEDDDENSTFSTSSEGMDFAIASGKSVMMFGSGDDRDDVKSLQKKISGDFIWFIHDGNAYVIRDAATVKSAKALFAPMEELGRKQEALGKQQEELGKQQEELGRQQEQVRVKVPADLEARLKKVEAEIRDLGSSATQDDLGRIQGELGDVQGYIGDLQGKAGDQQGELGNRQGELGEKQGELGRQQGELGEEQGRIAREGSRKMQKILKDALGSGLAQRAPT